MLSLAGCDNNTPDVSGNDVPEDMVVIISPHNEDIRFEFTYAFREYYREHFGKDVNLQWRDIGGGSTAILRYLRNVYSRSESSGIDILFGGGEYIAQTLAGENLLEKLDLQDDVLANIPHVFSGMVMYDKDLYWCGNVLSSFGFLYNIDLLKRLGIPAPASWDDLGHSRLFGFVMLADPTQSGSIAAAYEMIVQSADDWPSGWTRLLAVLSNANKFTDSSAATANAPVIGEAPVATCIDFYGTMRVAASPQRIGYVSPAGQTGYTPDPIAILKSPPNPQAAQAFVDFVLSPRGQALWALPPGHPDGPQLNYLNRPPIRKDFYTKYSEQDIPEWISRPYARGAEMIVDAELREVRYYILVHLVRAAAVDNLSLMKRAKKKIIERDYPADLIEEFNRLPDNIDTIEKVYSMSEKFSQIDEVEPVVEQWIQFFGTKYRTILAD